METLLPPSLDTRGRCFGGASPQGKPQPSARMREESYVFVRRLGEGRRHCCRARKMAEASEDATFGPSYQGVSSRLCIDGASDANISASAAKVNGVRGGRRDARRGVEAQRPGDDLRERLIPVFQLGGDGPVLALGLADTKLEHAGRIGAGRDRGLRNPFGLFLKDGGDGALAVVTGNKPLVQGPGEPIAVGVDMGLHTVGERAGQDTLGAPRLGGGVTRKARQHQDCESEGQIIRAHVQFLSFVVPELIRNAVLILPSADCSCSCFRDSVHLPPRSG